MSDEPEGCESEDGIFTCELHAGHEGKHRVLYRDREDRTWTDETAEPVQ